MTLARRILVTGGCGFIGSAFILEALQSGAETGAVLNLDKLTYAANPKTLDAVKDSANYSFVHGDICDRGLVARVFRDFLPTAVVHFAAESHVDRSILGPDAFLQTNVEGTFALLEAARAFLDGLSVEERSRFRFLHVSTDEVFGSLAPNDPAFREDTPYAPRSPYAASKAASDHLVRAWAHTYELPAIVTNCSNNYGPRQFPEKLIPLVLTYALEGKPLPIYGDGQQVRDWLYVGDHISALLAVLDRGRGGETYTVGGNNQRSNFEVVVAICGLLDELVPESRFRPHQQLLTYVEDRPGHDRRYAIDAGKIERDLGWRPQESFETGLRKTVRWYLEHPAWIEDVVSGAYRDWEATNYADRSRLAQAKPGGATP